MLSFDQISAARARELERKLQTKLADYIEWREGSFDAERFRDSRDYRLGEVIPYDWIPYGAELDGQDPLQQRGWHVQIYYKGRPRYYVRCTKLDVGWAVRWIGESWLAKDVASGIRWLDHRESELPTSKVRLVSSRIYKFSSFRLVESSRHLVVSASYRLRSVLPRNRLLSQKELLRRLLDYFGKDVSQGGVLPD